MYVPQALETTMSFPTVLVGANTLQIALAYSIPLLVGVGVAVGGVSEYYLCLSRPVRRQSSGSSTLLLTLLTLLTLLSSCTTLLSSLR